MTHYGTYTVPSTFATNNTASWGWMVPPPVEENPRLVRRGPVVFSTGRALSRRAFSWDVNGYYRELGLPFPYVDATRAQISRAYRVLDGQRNARLTFCLKQLLDRDVRAAYDATPLGGLFLDPYVEAEIKRRVIAEVLRRGHSQDDVDALRRAFADRDIDFEPPGSSTDSDTPEDAVDGDQPGVQDDERPARVTTDYAFSFYLWRSTCDNTERLQQWQDLLLAAFCDRKIEVAIALGYHGRIPHPYVLARVGFVPVVFLHEDLDPDASTAQSIADRVAQPHAFPTASH